MLEIRAVAFRSRRISPAPLHSGLPNVNQFELGREIAAYGLNKMSGNSLLACAAPRLPTLSTFRPPDALATPQLAPQLLCNHTLVSCAPLNTMESHSCKKYGGGPPSCMYYVTFPVSTAQSGLREIWDLKPSIISTSRKIRRRSPINSLPNSRSREFNLRLQLRSPQNLHEAHPKLSGAPLTNYSPCVAGQCRPRI